MKILDSDHCVALLRGVLDLGGRVAPTEEIAVTATGVGELTHGAHKSGRPAENLSRLDVLLAALTVLPFDESAARGFGSLKAALEGSGEKMDDLDLQIAAIALHYDCPLVTHNRKHFARIPGLVLEDWLG